MSNLKAIKRVSSSSGSNNKLRSKGLIPAILYGGKEANQNISIEKKDIKNLIHSDTFLSKGLELDVEGKKATKGTEITDKEGKKAKKDEKTKEGADKKTDEKKPAEKKPAEKK